MKKFLCFLLCVLPSVVFAQPYDAQDLMAVGVPAPAAEKITGGLKQEDDVAFASGGTVAIQEGTSASACSGTATTNGTTAVTVSTTCATTGSRIFLSRTADPTGTSTNDQGGCWATNISDGVSFDIDCTDAGDNGAMNWLIIHEAP